MSKFNLYIIDVKPATGIRKDFSIKSELKNKKNEPTLLFKYSKKNSTLKKFPDGIIHFDLKIIIYYSNLSH